MKVYVKVKTNAKTVKVDRVDDNHLRVSVKAPPVEGRANEAVVEVLSEYFNVPRSHISIISGFHSKQKTVHIK